jgi:cytoskeleton protein RodZ|tara:strand:+ start:282 stop:1133 length:852 start_codon:yes stop_codon:yes gene_type:complete
MEFVGEHLKKSRLKKKIHLKTVAEKLNIQLSFLKKIENNDFSDYLNLVYIIGYIRAYAKLLGLNENEVIKQFKDQNLIDKEDLIDELSKPLQRSNFYFLVKTFSVFSIILIFFSFYFIFIKTNDMHPNYSILPDIPESLESEIEEIEIQSTLRNVNKIQSENSVNEVSNLILRNINLNDDYIINESSVIASTPENQPVELDNIITLKIFKPTWIQLRNKENQIVLSRLMVDNEEYSYSVVDNFTLTTGNAGNILVLINGKARGKVGKKGEVIDSLIISSDFNN